MERTIQVLLARERDQADALQKIERDRTSERDARYIQCIFFT